MRTFWLAAKSYLRQSKKSNSDLVKAGKAQYMKGDAFKKLHSLLAKSNDAFGQKRIAHLCCFS